MADEKKLTEEELSRRSLFRRALRTYVGVLSVASVGVGSVQFLSKEKENKAEAWDGKAKKIAHVNDLKEPGVKTVFFPTSRPQDRFLLIKLPDSLKPYITEYGLKEQGLVALGGVCTHRGCMIDYNYKETLAGQPLIGPCMCHGSTFSAVNGAPLAGPAALTLPTLRLKLDQASGDILATEVAQIQFSPLPPIVTYTRGADNPDSKNSQVSGLHNTTEVGAKDWVPDPSDPCVSSNQKYGIR